MACQEGQYFETATGECRSCEIPCNLSEDLCRTMGCEDFYQQVRKTTMTTLSTINEAGGNTTLEYQGLSPWARTVIILVPSLVGCIAVLLLGIGFVFYIFMKVRKPGGGSIEKLLTKSEDERSQAIQYGKQAEC